VIGLFSAVEPNEELYSHDSGIGSAMVDKVQYGVLF
jgi:hypothetical protein